MALLEKNFSKDIYTAVYQVEDISHQKRLDQFLLGLYSNFSRESLKKKIREGQITISGRNNALRPSTRVNRQDLITVRIRKTSHEDEYWRGKPLDLQGEPRILFEDEDLLAISKPPFMSTHPTGKHLFNCATVYFEEKYRTSIHSIHRLDRETSGVLLLGKNTSCACALTPEFENGLVHKAYFFISRAGPTFQNLSSFEARERLGGIPTGPQRVYVNHFPENSKLGKKALTLFKVLHQEKGYVLGLAFPFTGRQHQIRVHAMAHGLPLLGDKLYMGSFELFQKLKDNLAFGPDYDFLEIPRQGLHSIALNIRYKNGRRTFFAPIPEDLRGWIRSKMAIDFSSLGAVILDQIKAIFPQS
jgi:RluA family pseudouridine synthase